MSKAVILSIRPEYCELIASGKKTVEVRKTIPKLETPFKCYIYCTLRGIVEFFKNMEQELGSYETVCKWNREKWSLKKGKVIGEFVCDRITHFNPTMNLEDLNINHVHIVDGSCINMANLFNYSHGKILHGWHISDLVIYDQPKELSEFYKHDTTYDNAFGWAFEDRAKKTPITRPPQSWCYVEELEL